MNEEQGKVKMIYGFQKLFFLYFKLESTFIEMVDLPIDKEELVKIVSAAQTRTFAEEVQMLSLKGRDLSWMLSGLGTDEKHGISNQSADLKVRETKYGNNHRYTPPLSTFCELFKEALDDFILKILMVASIVSIGVEVGTASSDHRKTAWIEGFVVLVAVGICSLVTAANNYSKERQFQDLNKVADARKRVTLRRQGSLLQLHQDELLVGDIVSISQGMEIPADAIVLQANQITTDESAMTGETDPMHKNTLASCLKKMKQIQPYGMRNENEKHEIPSPVLLSGTKILTGEGKMLILVVGESSCIGKIRKILTQEQQTLTPLQEKLEHIAKDIGKFGLYSAILILVILLVRFAILKGINKSWDSSVDLKELVGYLILSVTVIVVAIPQGLPLSVTLSLAVSVKKMLIDSNLVRRMDACQTMGGANNICSDKTGTLTMNKMTLTQIWNGNTIAIDTYNQKINLQELTLNNQWLQKFKICSCVNSTANLLPVEKGSSTQIALLKYFQKAGINYNQYREKYPTKMKYPFSSSRKRMSVIIQKGRQQWLFVKGASQIVLQSCSSWFDMRTNRVETISPLFKNQMNQAILKMASSSLRTLCLAYKPLNVNHNLQQKDEKGVFAVEKSDLILICIVGVKDIPRKQVPDAIKNCHRAGIKVRMVTGDNLITAKAIAREVGILKDGQQSLAMQGSDFIKLIGGVVCKLCRTKQCDCARDSKQSSQQNKPLRIDTIENAAAFDQIKEKLLVLARSRPQDKYALVTGLKERGEVVAVTGDGTNDAPALKKADVGFAMGIAGTEVAREAAAIILLDDNFNSIVKAVLWGRNIYDSIRKFIQFQLTVNVVAVVITMIGASLIKQEVLAPIQMLWINLIMDTLASLALATEPPSQQLLNRKPNSRKEHIVSKMMMKHIIGQAILQIIVLVILIFWGELFIPEYSDSADLTTYASHPEWKWRNGVVGGTVCSGRYITITGDNDYQTAYQETGIYSRHFTFIFNTFVMLQVFNFINCRKIHDQLNTFKGITDNMTFIVIVFSIFALQILLITFTGSAFHVYSNYGLVPKQWIMSILIGSMSMPWNFVLKFINIEEEEDSEDQVDQIMDPSRQELGGFNIIRIKSKDQKIVDPKMFNAVHIPFQSPAPFRNTDEIGFM